MKKMQSKIINVGLRMNKAILFVFLVLGIFQMALAQGNDRELAKKILDNEDFAKVKEMGIGILKTGFNAGSGYQQVWIRDLNTFIKYSLKAMPQPKVREALVKFFYFQGFDGNMVDGYEELPAGHTVDNYAQFARYDMPGYAFHKNTVETDQETSLVQAVYKYIKATGDQAILQDTVHGRSVLDRLEFALDYLMQFRFNKQYGLIWGATTADWGDVQPQGVWGVKLDEYSTPAIDIYDNAMFLIALDDFVKMTKDANKKAKWQAVHDSVMHHTR